MLAIFCFLTRKVEFLSYLRCSFSLDVFSSLCLLVLIRVTCLSLWWLDIGLQFYSFPICTSSSLVVIYLFMYYIFAFPCGNVKDPSVSRDCVLDLMDKNVKKFMLV